MYYLRMHRHQVIFYGFDCNLKGKKALNVYIYTCATILWQLENEISA